MGHAGTAHGTPLLAGAAKVDITPPLGLPMGGYGARQGVSTGVADPLHARALVLSDGSEPVVVVVCDLLGVSTDLVATAREQVRRDHGHDADRVLVAATHTHSGPAGFRRSDAPEFVERTAAAISAAVGEAARAARPVSLAAGQAQLTTIGRNRRHPDGPVEDTLRVLLADPGRQLPPAAVLVSYACHSTVREHDNLSYSADWPGAMARLVEQTVGGTAVYLQGAAGDVNPLWSAHDHTEVERIGGIAGAAAVKLVHEMRALVDGQWCVNTSWSEEIPVPAEGLRLRDVSLGGARRELELERRTRPGAEEVDAALADVRRHLENGGTSLEDRRRAKARRSQMEIEGLFSRAPEGFLTRAMSGRTRQRVELQALRVSPECAFVSLPGEFFAATGRDLARRAREELGIGFLLVAGYANGSVGYVPTADQYGEAGYEVGMTQFGPGAAEQISREALGLLASLY